MAEHVFCENCHYRIPANRPHPYSQALSGNPEVLDLWTKLEQNLQEVERAEREGFRLGLPFMFKPRFYSWCDWWTTNGGANCLKDQYGKPIVVYELTARRNAQHDCAHFLAEPPESR
jgi:hypothetical protein